MLIVLMGYMGCGKSSIGKELSENMQMPYIDLDDFIEEKEGKTVQEIFKTRGELFFRKLETKSLKELLSLYKNAVVSLGGGTPCYGNNLQIIHQYTAHDFYLKANIDTLTARLLSEKSHRPLIKEIKDEEIPEFIRKHLFERNFYYMKANHMITVDDKTKTEIALEIQEKLS